MSTPYAALRDALAADPSRPLVTYVGPEGRTELSVRTLENNVAKAAGLLRDGLDVQPGDSVDLLLGAHWQTAVWLGACWAVGAVACCTRGDAEVVLAFPERLTEASGADVLRVTRHPLGLPDGEALPPGVQEAAVEVRAHADVFTPYQAPAAGDPALRCGGGELSAGEVMDAAAALADRAGLRAGGRLLVTAEAPPRELVLALLAVPLAAGASVLISGAGEVGAAEQVTAVLA